MTIHPSRFLGLVDSFLMTVLLTVGPWDIGNTVSLLLLWLVSGLNAQDMQLHSTGLLYTCLHSLLSMAAAKID